MTQAQKVVGLVTDGDVIMRDEIIVRVTKDEKGRTLSLSNDRSAMVIVPCEQIQALLEWITKTD